MAVKIIPSGLEMIPSIGSPFLENLPSTMEEQSVELISIDIKIAGVKSDFRLSEDPNFVARLETVAIHCVGKHCQILRETLIIEYAHYAGKCRVSRNGYVSLQAQLSMEEADTVAKKVLWDFKNIAKQNVGMYSRRFTLIHLAGELPFEVNLNRLKRINPDVQYAPELQSAASIKFDDLKVTIQLWKSGKFHIHSTGDCEPVDYEMSTTTTAVDRLVFFVQDFIIRGTMKIALLAAVYWSNYVCSRSFCSYAMSSTAPCREDVGFPVAKKFVAPRRSERIGKAMTEDEMYEADRMDDDLSNFELHERRLHQFFSEFAGIFGAIQLCRLLKHIKTTGSSLSSSWEKVSSLFTDGPRKVVGGVSLPQVELRVPHCDALSAGSKSMDKRSENKSDRPREKGTTAVKKSGRPKVKKITNETPESKSVGIYVPKVISAVDAIRNEPMTRKDYLIRILSRMEQWR